MAAALIAQCPECGTKLAVKDPAALGKKARCGKCRHVFVLKASSKKQPPVEDEISLVEDDDELEDFGRPALAPRRPGGASKSKGKRKGKGKQSGAWVKPTLIGGGVVLGLGIVVGLVYFLSGSSGGDGDAVAATTGDGNAAAGAGASNGDGNAPGAANADPAKSALLGYLPADSEVVLTARVREMLQSPQLQRLTKEMALDQQMEQAGAMGIPTGGADDLKPDDIESITLGVAGVSDLAAAPEGQNPISKLRFAVVVRAAKPVPAEPTDPSAPSELEEVTHQGKTYHRAKEPHFLIGLQFAVWKPDDKTVVFGTDESVRQAIERGNSAGDLAGRFDTLDSTAHLAAAFVPKDPALFRRLSELEAEIPPQAPRQVRDLIAALRDNGRGVGFGLTLGDVVRPSLSASFASDAAAASAAKSLDELRIQADGLLNAAANDPELSPKDKQGVEAVQKLMAEVKIAASGSAVSLAGSMPAAAFASLQEQALEGAMAARGAARQSVGKSNLREIAIGVHNHHDTYLALPSTGWYSTDGQPMLSWRAGPMLNFLDESPLARQLRRDEPWDSEHNSQFIEQMPAIYQDPAIVGMTPPGHTTILGFSGRGAIFDDEASRPEAKLPFTGFTFRDVSDGLHMTILFVQAGYDKAVPWSKPQDLPFNDDSNPVEALGKVPATGFQVVAVDHSVHTLQSDIDPQALRALITRGGGEIFVFPDEPEERPTPSAAFGRDSGSLPPPAVDFPPRPVGPSSSEFTSGPVPRPAPPADRDFVAPPSEPDDGGASPPAAIDALRQKGVAVNPAASGKVGALTLAEGQVDAAAMQQVGQLTSLTSLAVRGRAFGTGETVPSIIPLKQLRNLIVVDSSFSDPAMAVMEHFTELVRFDLVNASAVTDAGLEPLSRNPKLQSLRLSGTGVQGAGLSHLAALAELKNLDLSRSPITGAALPNLKALNRLTSLDLSGAALTQAEVDDLKQALPGVAITAQNLGATPVPAVAAPAGGVPGDPAAIAPGPVLPTGIAGNWSVVSHQQQGVQTPGVAGNVTVTIGGGKFTVISGPGQQAVYDYTLDETKSPKQIDLAYKTRGRDYVDRGIYEIQGAMLRICLSKGTKRAEEFATTRRDNPIRTLMELQFAPGGGPGVDPNAPQAFPQPAPQPFPQPPAQQPQAAAPTLPAPQPAGQQEVVQVTAEELGKEHGQDYDRWRTTKLKYVGKRVRITGTVETVIGDWVLLYTTEDRNAKSISMQIQLAPGVDATIQPGARIMFEAELHPIGDIYPRFRNGKIIPPP
ncbi:MAG: DUF1559 domain-containing protein [Planctomycetales bacterium]